MEKRLNIKYGCIHGTYWMYFGVVGSFASAFLLAKGYSNAEIGLILAVGNILAASYRRSGRQIKETFPHRGNTAFRTAAYGTYPSAVCSSEKIGGALGCICTYHGVDDHTSASLQLSGFQA